jgi:hypothetical protein
MSYPLRRPEPPATFTIGDFDGQIVLVVIGGYHEQVPTAEYGMRPAERCSVVMLTGPTSGRIYEDVMLFGNKLSSQFSAMEPGDVALCRIIQKGRGTQFAEGNSYDEQMANQWIASNLARVDQLRADTVRKFQEGREQIAKELAARQQPPPMAQTPSAPPVETGPPVAAAGQVDAWAGS